MASLGLDLVLRELYDSEIRSRCHIRTPEAPLAARSARLQDGVAGGRAPLERKAAIQHATAAATGPGTCVRPLR